MNIVFFGSSDFALPALEVLLSTQHKISCVVTQPDRQKGRGLHLDKTAVKSLALKSGLAIYQPENINTSEAIKFINDKSADLFVVVSYGQILSKAILEIPKFFALNAHASILPKYRGAAPINWAIINGDAQAGVTIMKMEEKMDAGPIIMQEFTEINDADTALTLAQRLSLISATLLVSSIKHIENNDYRLIIQDEDKVNFAPKLKKDDGWIDWNRPAREIYNLVRGCLAWPGAFTSYKGKLLKIYTAKISNASSLPGGQKGISCGRIMEVSKEGITVSTGQGGLVIQELQIEGKRRMQAPEFISGHKISEGDAFDKKYLHQ